MNSEFQYSVEKVRFDEDYLPAETTRLTTNFANLARGANRQANLRHTLKMMDNRFNSLASWDNPRGDRYQIELDIVSVSVQWEDSGGLEKFPLMEFLQTHVVDHTKGARVAGMLGNNFSSYVRDYDFSVWLQAHNHERAEFSVPEGFGDLHGKLFQHFLASEAYRRCFEQAPVICLSVASGRSYERTALQHPVLGWEYRQTESSLTDQYFQKMGLKVRYFMPANSVAPLAFYCAGHLLADYSNLALISTISTMETFQRIYRPEIYNANAPAAQIYQPSLKNSDYSLTQIVYDREERSQLALQQGKFTQEHFIQPHQKMLSQWVANTQLQ